MRIVTVANEKGGVGKTTVAVNLAAALGLAGSRVLLIDLDSQGHATQWLGIPKGKVEPELCRYHAFLFSPDDRFTNVVLRARTP